jgi:preprotein translocase SecE subunit
MILALIVCADLAYNGAYGRFSAYLEGVERVRLGGAATGRPTAQLVQGIIFSVLAGVALFGGLFAAGFHRRAVDFLIEVEQEMLKVEWPKGDTLWKSTVVIAIVIAVLGVVIFAADGIILYLLDSLRSLGGKF